MSAPERRAYSVENLSPLAQPKEVLLATWPSDIKDHISTDDEVLFINHLFQMCSDLTPQDYQSMIAATGLMMKGHFGQKREVDNDPFSRHPLTTAILASNLKLDAETRIIGSTHDVVEDTRKKAVSITVENIRDSFGDIVADGVFLLSKVIRARVQEEVTMEQETQFHIVEAAVKNLRAAIVKCLEQWDNTRTLFVKSPQEIKEKAIRARNFYAPLARALGMPDIAYDLINSATEAEFSQEVALIKKGLKERKLLGPERESEIKTALQVLNIPIDDQHLYIQPPTYYDLLTSIQYGEVVEKETIPYKVDIPYSRGDLTQAASYFVTLRRNFTPTPPYDFEKLFETGRLEFTLTVAGGPVHIRLLPHDEYKFQRVSLLPLVQLPGVYTSQEYKAAEQKHQRWIASLEARRGQLKRFTIEEFIRFLEGEQAVRVTAPDGKEYEFPRGATFYDYICRLGLQTELLHGTHAIVTKDSKKITYPLSAPIPDGAIVTIESDLSVITLKADTLDYVTTTEGKEDVRKALRRRIRAELSRLNPNLEINEKGIIKLKPGQQISEEELEQVKQQLEEHVPTLFDLYLRGNRILQQALTQRFGTIAANLPLEVGLAPVAARYKPAILQVQDPLQTLLIETGLNRTPPRVLKTILDAMERHVTSNL